MDIFKKNWLKFSIAIILCTLFRFFPLRPPNIEPILATQMPLSRYLGKYSGFLFGFLLVFIFDLLTFKVGIWTLITGTSYGLLGVFSFYFFRNIKENKTLDYIKFAILGTLFFDITTGLTIGPLFFKQSFMESILGQIPFTLWHLLGNISFAFVLSPSLYKFFVENKKFESFNIINVFNYKKI